jgi:hypothetical protein
MKMRVVDTFKSHQYLGHYRPFKPYSPEFHNTGAKYYLYEEDAFFCGLCLGSVPIPIFCITSMDRTFGNPGSKIDSFGNLFDKLMLASLGERNWAVMIIEWIAGLVASSYSASKIIPRR